MYVCMYIYCGVFTSLTVESLSIARIASIASATPVVVPLNTNSTGGGSGVLVLLLLAL